LEQSKGAREGDGTLLDHSLILHGGGISDADQHSHIDLPLVLVGGAAAGIKGGRVVRYSKETPMNNLLLLMLDKAGVHPEKFGDGTASLPL
jgi:hypothetical protein